MPAPSDVQSRLQEQQCLGPQTWCRATHPEPTGTSKSLIKAKKTLFEGFSSTALYGGFPQPFFWFDSLHLPSFSVGQSMNMAGKVV